MGEIIKQPHVIIETVRKSVATDIYTTLQREGVLCTPPAKDFGADLDSKEWSIMASYQDIVPCSASKERLKQIERVILSIYYEKAYEGEIEITLVPML